MAKIFHRQLHTTDLNYNSYATSKGYSILSFDFQFRLSVCIYSSSLSKYYSITLGSSSAITYRVIFFSVFVIFKIDIMPSSSGEEEKNPIDYDAIPAQYNVGIDHQHFSGATYWTPEVDDVFKPVRGTTFDNISQAYKFFKDYGLKYGFEVRKSTQTYLPLKRGHFGPAAIKLKYFVCSRAGYHRRKGEKTGRVQCC